MFLFFCFVVPGVVFTRLLCHFGVILVSVVVFWPPRAPLKGPRRKSDEKVGSLAAFWLPQGVPLEHVLCVFLKLFLVMFSKRFWEGFLGLWGFPPTTKSMVSYIRNHRFHISTWSSRTIENDAQSVPFRTPLGGFGRCWDLFWGIKK